MTEEPSLAAPDAYSKLIALLDEAGATYRTIDHEEEGRTDLVSAMRGHATSEAAKCIILMVKLGRKDTRFVLAVVPGDARVNLDAIKRMKRGTFIRFAEQQVAEKLSGSVAGTILPFPFDSRLELIVDDAVAESKTMYFNAGRLDRSIALETADYMRIARPRVERIALRS